MRSSASPSFFSSEQSAALLRAGVQAGRCAPAGGEAAGLVSSKTSDPSFLDVGFSRKLVMERRVKRLRRQVWAAGHLHRFRTPNGMTQRQIAKNAVGYLMKYLSKISPFHQFPKGVRLYGLGGLTQQARSICSWLNLPSWCKQRFGVGELKTVAGRRVVRTTGEILEALYRRVLQPSGMRLYPNGPLPARWADGPYSSLDSGALLAGAP